MAGSEGLYLWSSSGGRCFCLLAFWGFQSQSNLPPAVMNVFLPPRSVPSCYLSLSKTSSQLPTGVPHINFPVFLEEIPLSHSSLGTLVGSHTSPQPRSWGPSQGHHSAWCKFSKIARGWNADSQVDSHVILKSVLGTLQIVKVSSGFFRKLSFLVTSWNYIKGTADHLSW